jgi:hypothetical protein
MAEHAASAGGLRAQAAVRRPPLAEVIVQYLHVGNATPPQGYWRSHRRASRDRIAHD